MIIRSRYIFIEKGQLSVFFGQVKNNNATYVQSFAQNVLRPLQKSELIRWHFKEQQYSITDGSRTAFVLPGVTAPQISIILLWRAHRWHSFIERRKTQKYFRLCSSVCMPMFITIVYIFMAICIFLALLFFIKGSTLPILLSFLSRTISLKSLGRYHTSFWKNYRGSIRLLLPTLSHASLLNHTLQAAFLVVNVPTSCQLQPYLVT